MTFSDNLDKLLSSPTSSFAKRSRPNYPTGWEPGVLHSDNGSLTVTTDRIPKMDDEESWKAANINGDCNGTSETPSAVGNALFCV